jgi:hypothetical protein
MAKQTKVPVTKRALVQRINRKLLERHEQLLTARGENARAELGDFYIVGTHAGGVTDKHVEPEKLGRELGALKPYEVLAEE